MSDAETIDAIAEIARANAPLWFAQDDKWSALTEPMKDDWRPIGRALLPYLRCQAAPPSAPALADCGASVRLRFVTCGDPISRLIRAGEMGFWASHVEAVMPDGTYLGAHEKGGVLARAPDYDANQWTQQLFVDLPCSQYQADAFHQWLRDRIGEKYDLGAILDMVEGVLAGIAPAAAPNHLHICSALVTRPLLKYKFFAACPCDERLITPRDVLFMCAAKAAVGAPMLRKAAA